MSEQREQMRVIAERVAEALGVSLGCPGWDGIPLGTKDQIISSSPMYERALIWFGNLRWTELYQPVLEFRFDQHDRFLAGRYAPSSKKESLKLFDDSIRAKMQRIDAQLDGLLSYGIDRGGDEALRAWWRKTE